MPRRRASGAWCRVPNSGEWCGGRSGPARGSEGQAGCRGPRDKNGAGKIRTRDFDLARSHYPELFPPCQTDQSTEPRLERNSWPRDANLLTFTLIPKSYRRSTERGSRIASPRHNPKESVSWPDPETRRAAPAASRRDRQKGARRELRVSKAGAFVFAARCFIAASRRCRRP
jgi:hypothetical protein